MDENKSPGEDAAEGLRQKGHEFASTAKSGVDAVGERVEQASAFVRKADEIIDDTERRLNELIDTAERLFDKGAAYTGKAKAWLDDHQDYKARAQNLVHKAGSLRDRFGGEGRESGSTEGMAEGLREAGRRRVGEAGRQVKERARGATSFVRENPTDALLIGAAIGVLAGTALKHLRGESVEETPYTGGGNPYGV